mmetsp:Transcript_367/g.672  ORF Transcript_367/g.672 Transcript_367/m.672 type:complete len:298 (-) Transcript_367:909-1802(-)
MRTRINSGKAVNQLERGTVRGGGVRSGCIRSRKLLWPYNAICLVCAVVVYLFGLYLVYSRMQSVLDAEGGYVLKLPRSIEDVKAMKATAAFLLKDNYLLVLFGFCAIYLFKQTFAVPGSVFLNIVAGMVWGLPLGWPLVCVLSASGATFCYLLSWLIAGDMVDNIGPDSTGRFKKSVYQVRLKSSSIQDRQGWLPFLVYLTSLRLFPATPNWLLNFVLPHCKVPIHLFFFSVLLGLLPYNFVTVSAGNVLATVNSTADIFDVGMMLRFSVAAILLAGFAPFIKSLGKLAGIQACSSL